MEKAGYAEIQVPEEAFKKDLKMEQAVGMLERLQKLGKDLGRGFGIKLTNTLGIKNHKSTLPGQEMYLSGRPLFPLSINVAKVLAERLDQPIPMSFSGGITAQNIQAVMEAGIGSVTICTELLKPGGYLRLRQMVKNGQRAALPAHGNVDTAKLAALAEDSLSKKNPYKNKGWRGGPAGTLPKPLPLTNCFTAPCQQACPLEQDVATYIKQSRAGEFAQALQTILKTNALPALTSFYCSQKCQKLCIRKDYEGGIAIRELKKEAVEKGLAVLPLGEDFSLSAQAPMAAILGYGVPTLSAAHRLLQLGYAPTVFSAGEDQYILPGYKFPEDKVQADVDLLEKLGVNFSSDNGELPTEADLREAGFTFVLDTTAYQKETLIDDMAQGRALLGQPIPALSQPEPELPVSTQPRPDFLPVKSELYFEASLPENQRCLDCDIVCNKCVDVCPNRANFAIPIAGEKDKTQIIHLDALCNECGNCSSFCPWEGDPFKDKYTVFWSQEDFDDSANPGFYLAGDRVQIRDGHGLWETALSPEGDFLNPKANNELTQKVFRTLFQEHPYLMPNSPSGRSR
jgi:putative selenate reductase